MTPLLDINAILQNALTDISDPHVVTALRGYLVPPREVMRDWDYKDDTQYPCWIIAVDVESQTAITYCDFGFGPTCPWGLRNEPSSSNEMGPDYCWYSRLEDAFRQSMMWDGDNPPDYEVQ